MAALTEEQRKEAQTAITAGLKPKAIAIKLNVPVGEIYKLKSSAKKSAPGATKKSKRGPAKKVKADEFEKALAKERARVDGEVQRLTKLIEGYAGFNSDFVEVLERKFKAEKVRQQLLNEFE